MHCGAVIAVEAFTDGGEGNIKHLTAEEDGDLTWIGDVAASLR